MNKQDEELQRKIEQGDMTDNSADAIAYRKVFDSLSKAPVFETNFDLAERVVSRIVARQESKNTVAYVLFGIGIVIMLIGFAFVFGYVLAASPVKFNWSLFESLATYKWFIILAIVILTAVNIVDKRLMSRFEQAP